MIRSACFTGLYRHFPWDIIIRFSVYKQDRCFVCFHCLQGRIFPQGNLCQAAAPEADYGHENATWGMVFVRNCPGDNIIRRSKRTVGNDSSYLRWQRFSGCHDYRACTKGKSAEKDLMFGSETVCYIINPLPTVFSFINTEGNIFAFTSAAALQSTGCIQGYNNGLHLR